MTVAHRTVKDTVTYFGDIGGYSGFLLAFFSIFVGSIPKRLFEMNKAQRLFRVNTEMQKKSQGDLIQLRSLNNPVQTKLNWFSATKALQLGNARICKLLL